MIQAMTAGSQAPASLCETAIGEPRGRSGLRAAGPALVLWLRHFG